MYRILHKPSGLYYRPRTWKVVKGVYEDGSKWSRYVKTNLSTTPKVYVRRPSLKHISSIYDHNEAKKRIENGDSSLKWREGALVEVTPDDFEIQQIQ